MSPPCDATTTPLKIESSPHPRDRIHPQPQPPSPTGSPRHRLPPAHPAASTHERRRSPGLHNCKPSAMNNIINPAAQTSPPRVTQGDNFLPSSSPPPSLCRLPRPTPRHIANPSPLHRPPGGSQRFMLISDTRIPIAKVKT
ncbi:hypothetical protein F511_45089 [Dorcoceras hygrometricum]|uniref:Uncharacterized protein n=1 Tax=Dorcoceras hygrometricum TaxID=472368 RepID=A0A2Z6ZX34_9LAMI|nr:hypothetical protein F511_45089 [Dorcoceras hygrometricum]